jgi:hypothetical protein
MTTAHRGLLAHLVTRFAPQQWENVASESLRFLLIHDGGRKAVNDLLAPLGFSIHGESWRSQASSADDSSIPDLVAEVGGRQKLIIEAKFWASLTENQPLGYLDRQARQFGADEDRLLVFLAPTRRRHLLTAELEQRMGVRHRDIGSLAVVESDRGRLAVVDWADMLGHLRAAFTALTDGEALGNLAQLEGLCERADQEAMLPITAEDLDPRRPQRQMEFQRIVRRIFDILVADGGFSLKGVRETSSFEGSGKYVMSPSGKGLFIWVSLTNWGYRWPTPWWIRLSDPSHELSAWAEAVRSDPDVCCVERDGSKLHVGLRAPLGVEEHKVAAELVQVILRICEPLPAVVDATDEEPLPDAE